MYKETPRLVLRIVGVNTADSLSLLSTRVGTSTSVVQHYMHVPISLTTTCTPMLHMQRPLLSALVSSKATEHGQSTGHIDIVEGDTMHMQLAPPQLN